MPHLEPDDNRMHLSGDEREERARKIRMNLRASMTFDPITAPACGECVVATLILALMEEIDDAVKGGQANEMLGIGDLMGRLGPIVQEARDTLTAKGIAAAMLDPQKLLGMLTRLAARP